jgi:ATP-dependent DNA helicase RecQ
MSEIKKAVVALPKPMIIYTLYPHDAVSIETELRAMGLSRLASFTGKTPTDRRDRLIGEWGNGELDIMIATSAFGLGMDKANVRSVVHAAVPENIDRFYQEVGRSGRDGLVSQSLVIYFDEQIAQARKLNSTRLITVELGLKKWREMWKHGEILTDGSRNVHVSTLRGDQQRQTDGNQEWNWRTLLLMQRAGLVRIELKRPQPPENAADTDYESYRALLKQYYDHYYDNVTIIPITDDPLNQDVWDKRTKQRRHYEKSEQSRSFELLLGWLRGSSNTALCDVLLDNYTIEGIEPEYACGGCPKCLADGLSIEPPTVGRSAHASGVDALGSVMSALPEGPVHQYVYFPKGKSSNKRMVRSWEFWIRRLLETEGIAAISATPDVLEILEKVLSTNVFWIGDNIDNPTEEWRFWPRLILHTEINRPRPHLGLKDSVKILLAPEELVDESNPNRKWWESVSNSVSLDNFLRA